MKERKKKGGRKKERKKERQLLRFLAGSSDILTEVFIDVMKK
jgi:hypothetical protein